ncbi:MAG: hypothetical protein KDA77_16230, partial [Planctomycetaceae bacterium]|nr:hypothetical protein [Planctomycetaceae bacterium]
MSITETVKIELNYGVTGKFRCEIPSERLIWYHQAPAPIEDVLQKTQQVLKNPLELPPLDLAVVPGDKITITVDYQVPAVSEIINSVWEFLSDCGIEAADVTVLQTQSGDPELHQKLQAAVSKELR